MLKNTLTGLPVLNAQRCVRNFHRRQFDVARAGVASAWPLLQMSTRGILGQTSAAAELAHAHAAVSEFRDQPPKSRNPCGVISAVLRFAVQDACLHFSSGGVFAVGGMVRRLPLSDTAEARALGFHFQVPRKIAVGGTSLVISRYQGRCCVWRVGEIYPGTGRFFTRDLANNNRYAVGFVALCNSQFLRH